MAGCRHSVHGARRGDLAAGGRPNAVKASERVVRPGPVHTLIPARPQEVGGGLVIALLRGAILREREAVENTRR